MKYYRIKIIHRTAKALKKYGLKTVSEFLDHTYVGDFSMSRGGTSILYIGDDKINEAVLFTKESINSAICFVKKTYERNNRTSKIIKEEVEL